MILLPDGTPATQPMRRAAGFTDRVLPVELGDVASFTPRRGRREGEWHQRGDSNGWCGGQRQEPFAQGGPERER